MKLLLCPRCGDVRKLRYNETRCECGASWGSYAPDGLKATIGGEALCLGLGNLALDAAICAHRVEPVEQYTLTAWMMRDGAPNVERAK